MLMFGPLVRTLSRHEKDKGDPPLSGPREVLILLNYQLQNLSMLSLYFKYTCDVHFPVNKQKGWDTAI